MKNKDLICYTIANYIIENKSTIRKAASVFFMSKSNVYQIVTKRLKKIDENQYFEVRKILDYNNSIKHIRGGESTKNKYKKTSH